MSGAAGSSRHARLWAAAALAAIPLVAFFRPLFSATFFFRDLYLLFFFERVHVARQLAAGHLPLWEPFLHGGRPLLSNLNFTALYPTNILYLVFPHVAAFNLEIVLHYALAGAAAYLAARALGLGRAGALAAAAGFELCGYSLSLANLVNRLLALPWLPLLFVAWQRYLARPRRRYLFAAAAFGALQVLAGFPELSVISFGTLFLWSLAAPSPLARGRRVAALAAAGTLALGLSAVQLVPTAMLVPRTVRGSGLDAETLTLWSVHPARLPELVVPGFLGRTDRIPDADYWGRAREDLGFPYVLSLYLGVPLLLLAALGATDGDSPIRAPARRLLAALAVAALVLSLGRHLPLFSPLLALSHVQLFRYPVKLAAAALLPLCLLAAAGTDRLRRGAPPRRALGAATAIAVVLAATAAAFAASAGFRTGLERLFFGSPSVEADTGLAGGLLHASLASAAIAAVLVLARRGAGRRIAHGAAAALVFGDLFAAGARVNPYAPRSFFDPPPLVSLVKSHLHGGRLYRAPEPLHARVAGSEIALLDRFNLERLRQYTAAGYDIPIVYGADFDGLLARRVSGVGQLVEKSPWRAKVKLLAASGATLVLSGEPVAAPGLEAIARTDPGGEGLTLYRNTLAAPAVGLFSTWRSVAGGREAVNAIASEGFDPRAEIVVEGGPTAPGGAASPSVPLAPVEDGPAKRSLRVATPAEAALFLATTEDPGWAATVDGVPRPILRANAAFQAVIVPPGEHEVRLTYWPPGLTAGLAVTLATLLGIAVAAAVPRRP